MTHAAYSDLKAGYDLKRIQDMRDGFTIAPSQIQLIISDLCNQDCHFCSYRMSDGLSSEQFGEDTGLGFTMNPNRMIPKEKCFEILDDAAEAGVQAVQFTGGGEPTVHPQHLEIFRHALGLGLKCGLVTNGVILREGWESALPGFDWVRVSIDAGTPESYSKIRGVPATAYRKALGTVASLSAWPEVLLGVGFVVTEENWHEIALACEQAKAAGASYARISAVFSKSGPVRFRGLDDKIRSQIRRAKMDWERDGFSVVDLYGDRLTDLQDGAPNYRRCGYQEFNLYIGGNQKLYRCCTTAYTQRGEVGDLKNMRLRDWLFAEARHKDLASFDARGCSVCQFNNKNRVIDYLTGPKPLHAEFV